MSFPSLLVILFWGAGRLASIRFLCQFCFNIVDTYDINPSIPMTRVTLWVTKKNTAVVLARISFMLLNGYREARQWLIASLQPTLDSGQTNKSIYHVHAFNTLSVCP